MTDELTRLKEQIENCLSRRGDNEFTINRFELELILSLITRLESVRNEALETAERVASHCMITYAAVGSVADELKQIELCRRDIAARIAAFKTTPQARRWEDE